eukprot:7918470-Pyramimonas_sp.AAC.1
MPVLLALPQPPDAPLVHGAGRVVEHAVGQRRDRVLVAVVPLRHHGCVVSQRRVVPDRLRVLWLGRRCAEVLAICCLSAWRTSNIDRENDGRATRVRSRVRLH